MEEHVQDRAAGQALEEAEDEKEEDVFEEFGASVHGVEAGLADVNLNQVKDGEEDEMD